MKNEPNKALEPTTTVEDYFMSSVKFTVSDFRVAVVHL